MYPQTLYPKTKQVLESLKENLDLANWYLAGGTGLSLQLGHRKSIDLDFFSDKFPKHAHLLSRLKPLSPTIIQEAPGTIDLMINDVKVSFLEYKYPLLEPYEHYQGINIASITDIACMKLSAISSRGSKKDFIDFNFILERHSLKEVLVSFEKKYRGINYHQLHILKSLIYFADANNEPDPDMAVNANWEDIKKNIESKVRNLLFLIR